VRWSNVAVVSGSQAMRTRPGAGTFTVSDERYFATAPLTFNTWKKKDVTAS
jgi:hypothetical protein